MPVKKFKDRVDETKNRKTLRQACYQYMIDHAYPSPKGMLVNFYLPQKDDFFRKLEAREYLEYIRVAKEDGWLGYNDWFRKWQKIEKAYYAKRVYEERWAKMKENANWKLKILLFVHAKINKHIKTKYLNAK